VPLSLCSVRCVCVRYECILLSVCMCGSVGSGPNVILDSEEDVLCGSFSAYLHGRKTLRG
jgi:hypothetical protein